MIVGVPLLLATAAGAYYGPGPRTEGFPEVDRLRDRLGRLQLDESATMSEHLFARSSRPARLHDDDPRLYQRPAHARHHAVDPRANAERLEINKAIKPGAEDALELVR